MSKHKTRQQKIIADLHRKLSLQNATSISSVTLSDLPSKPEKRPLSSQPHPLTVTYIVTDLRKTLLLTAIIIALELLLFFLLRNHIVSIPMVRY